MPVLVVNAVDDRRRAASLPYLAMRRQCVGYLFRPALRDGDDAALREVIKNVTFPACGDVEDCRTVARDVCPVGSAPENADLQNRI